jgi:hypothetical protein
MAQGRVRTVRPGSAERSAAKIPALRQAAIMPRMRTFCEQIVAARQACGTRADKMEPAGGRCKKGLKKSASD